MARSATRSRSARRARAATRRAPLLVTLFRALKDAAIKIYEEKCIGLAKEAAFSFILSFFPMLVAFIAFFFIWGEPEQSIAEVLAAIRRVMPADSYKIVDNYIRNMSLNPQTGLFWISLAGAFWTASGIMSTLQNAFNVIYEVPSQRNFWMRRLVAFLLVIGTGIPLIAATIITIFGEQLERYLAHRYGFDHILALTWSLARWVIVLLTTVLIAAFCYRIGVERKQSWRGVFPGAVLATLLWLVATLLFNFYVQNFGSYNRVYGSLGAVIILLVWMFITALALLYGAAFNLALERQSPR